MTARMTSLFIALLALPNGIAYAHSGVEGSGMFLAIIHPFTGIGHIAEIAIAGLFLFSIGAGLNLVKKKYKLAPVTTGGVAFAAAAVLALIASSL